MHKPLDATYMSVRLTFGMILLMQICMIYSRESNLLIYHTDVPSIAQIME